MNSIRISVDCPLAPAQATTPPEIACTQCGTIDIPAIEHGHWGPHRIRAVCRHCGGFAKWLSGKTPEQRQAARRRGINGWMVTQAPTAKQISLLRALGHRGEPANRLEARKAIGQLLGKEVANG